MYIHERITIGTVLYMSALLLTLLYMSALIFKLKLHVHV